MTARTAIATALLAIFAGVAEAKGKDGVVDGWVKSSEKGATPCLRATAAVRAGRLRLILSLTPRVNDQGFLMCDAKWPVATTVGVSGVKAADGTTMLLPQPGIKEHDEQVPYQNLYGAQFVGRRQGWSLPLPSLDVDEIVVEMVLTDGNTGTFKIKTKDLVAGR